MPAAVWREVNGGAQVADFLAYVDFALGRKAPPQGLNSDLLNQAPERNLHVTRGGKVDDRAPAN